ncbi:MAG: alpha-amylase [Xanthomonadales bacterium]|nr:alpha-amylase [Xanthomonadales bacterium]
MSFSPCRVSLKLLGALMASALLSGVQAKENSTGYFPELPPFEHRPIQDDLIYFMITDRFNNADPSNDRGGVVGDRMVHGFDPSDEKFYHGGDLKGVTAKLDYLADMGVTAIWLTPIFKNKWVMQHDQWVTASYHGYWISDFTSIDPHLGTEDDFRELVSQAHQRDMKIILDIVINHTADTVRYRQCHDPDFQGEDKEAPGSGCVYRNSSDFPYTTRGNINGKSINPGFSGTDEADQTDANFEKLTDPAYAYTPFISESEQSLKKPDWLNNPIYYHNRGEIVYEGEAFYLGDFYGLDDVFTENPRVVQGMIDIYQYWVREFGIDGFRIDTVGHVNTEFFTHWAPALLQHARENDRPEFIMFGEVINTVLNKRGYISKGKLPALLDFDFKHLAAEYVAGSGSAAEFAHQFLDTDDYFIDHDTSAYSLPTFLSNHDDCRFGVAIEKHDPAATETTRLKRTKLAHALMYFARGIPILYYGDEQGFQGEPGFHECREDMLAGKVDIFNDNNLLATDQTTADSNFDTQHPLYQYIKQLSLVYRQHPTLRHGDQHVRYADDGEGIVAWSRVDPKNRTEYLLVFNNAQVEKQANIPVFSRDTTWSALVGTGKVKAAKPTAVSVSVPALGFVVLKADKEIPSQDIAPRIAFKSPAVDYELRCSGFVEVELDEDVLSRVEFAAKQGDSDWKTLGTDTNKPYRIYIDKLDYSVGETLTLRASTSAYASKQNNVSIEFKIGAANGACE